MTRDLSYDVAFRGFETTRRETTSATKDAIADEKATRRRRGALERRRRLRYRPDRGAGAEVPQMDWESVPSLIPLCIFLFFGGGFGHQPAST